MAQSQSLAVGPYSQTSFLWSLYHKG